MKNRDLFQYFSEKLPSVDGEVLTVSEITARIKRLLIENFGNSPFWIKGEISNYRGKSAQGHIYFKLKDEKAVISAAFFSYANKRLSFDLEEGMQVLVLGRIGLYEPQGSYQIIVEAIKPAGIGELYLRFTQLKKKLEKEGLFDESRKREIPPFPERIGIITSPTGAALRDMIKIIRSRLKSVDITVFPVRVQGEAARTEIAGALDKANRPEFGLDVIIIGRGGGSIEELWPFNEEITARAIAASKIPVISAVGHETDFTISDFVADLRASTPSNAAELVVPDRRELEQRIDSILSDIASSLREELALYRERLGSLAKSRVMRDPFNIIRDREQLLEGLTERVHALAHRSMESTVTGFTLLRNNFVNLTKLLLGNFSSSISNIQTALRTLNPLAVLERGYSIVRSGSGKIIKSHTAVDIGERILLTMHDGEIRADVVEKGEKRDEEKTKD